MTIIRREYFPVRKQVKLTEQLIINGTALPYAYSFDGAADITVRAKSEKRGYSHGSTISGDGFIDGKKITLGFVIEGSTPAEHDAKLNDLYQLMYQRDYQLQSGSGRGYYNIACMASTKEKWVDSFKGTKGEVDITLLYLTRSAMTALNLNWLQNLQQLLKMPKLLSAMAVALKRR